MPLKTTAGNYGEAAKGRGASINPEGRFEVWNRDAVEDGWFQEPEESANKPKTVIAIERAKSVISRHNSPDVGFSQSINPYRGCAHGCSYCQSGDTPVLMGDGRTRALSELKVGDEIYGTKRIGNYRRYVKSRVLAHWSTIKPAYRIALEDGTELVSSGDHRYLSDRGWKFVTGTEQGRFRRPFLTLSNKLMGTGAFAEGPLEDDNYRRGYLCGLVRGDAHLAIGNCTSPSGRIWQKTQFRLALVDPDALLRAQDYLLDFEVATQEFLFQAAVGARKALRAILSKSRSNPAVSRLADEPHERVVRWIPRRNFRRGRQFEPDGFQNSEYGSRDHWLDNEMPESVWLHLRCRASPLRT
jgi:hypothetical protein